VTGLRELVRRGEPGRTRADDDNREFLGQEAGVYRQAPASLGLHGRSRRTGSERGVC
jgi:hypothetical protein